jgi:TatD DNase family protein
VWFETHAHLSDSKFDSDRDQVIERAFASGLSTIVEIADGPEEWPKAQALAERYPGKIWWAAGLHPYYADKSSPALWAALKKISKHTQFVAIGEVGLDYAKCPIPPSDQQKAFRSGIELALEIDTPLIIHCREAYNDLMPILREHFKGGRCPGVVHCFSGNGENAAELVEMGFYLGVDGPITYPNAKSLREALEKIPASSLVLETDSPYLPPQPHRGQRNEPSYLPQIGTHLASLRGNLVANFAETTSENGRRLFRLNRAQ